MYKRSNPKQNQSKKTKTMECAVKQIKTSKPVISQRTTGVSLIKQEEFKEMESSKIEGESKTSFLG